MGDGNGEGRKDGKEQGRRGHLVELGQNQVCTINREVLASEPDAPASSPPQIEHGWWLGKKNGQLGAFPSNFVELLDSGPPSETWTL